MSLSPISICIWRGKKLASSFALNYWFCVNLGGNGLLQSLTNYLIIKALVNIIKLQMCVFFRIFVCEFKSEKAPFCIETPPILP